MVVWRLLVSLMSVGCILARPQHSQPYCYMDDTNPYRLFATKTPYNYSRGHFSHLDLVPEGKQIYSQVSDNLLQYLVLGFLMMY